VARGSDLIVGLDLGTTKTCAIIAEAHGGEIDVIGIGISPSKGLKKGMVVHIDATVEAIRRALEEAELMAGTKVDSVFVGIAGSHIKGLNSRGVIAISGKGREVSREDVERVIEAAKAMALPPDREVIHVLPQEFAIDDQRGIKEPLGMSGVRLEAEVHIVTGAASSIQNLVKCVRRAGLFVQDIVLQQFASSLAVLTPDEKELGVILVDIGGGTSDIAVFVEGNLLHTAVLALGGDHVTQDIAIGLRTPAHEAEELKRKHGCALASLVQDHETIEVMSVGGRKSRVLPRRMLAEIIQPRMEEILLLAEREARRGGSLGRVAAGVVVTGGSSLMEGLPELGEQVFDLPVRRGLPWGVGGLVDVVSSPIYATGVGLVLYGAQHRKKHRLKSPLDGPWLGRVIRRVSQWFNEFF